MMHLSSVEELAYRRIIDMIYASDDSLEDNDESLKWSTKAGTKWQKVKKRLLELEKIEVIDGRISNAVCRQKLAEAKARIEQKSIAGKASAEARKQLNLQDTASTAVSTGEPTSEPTNYQSSNIKEDNTKPPLPSGSRVEEKNEVSKNLKGGNGGGGGFDILEHIDRLDLSAAAGAVDGWDIKHLARIFNESVNSGRLQVPRAPAKAFTAWCRSYTKGKKP